MDAQNCSFLFASFHCILFLKAIIVYKINEFFIFTFLVPKDKICRRTVKGEEYIGNISTTKSGRTCQEWKSQTPHKHSYCSHLEKNFCRNPDGEDNGPWCYTTDRNKRWEYCDVPFCPGKKV